MTARSFAFGRGYSEKLEPVLVLKLKRGESAQIGGDVTVKWVDLQGQYVHLGIVAPADLDISRVPASAPTEKKRGTQNFLPDAEECSAAETGRREAL